MPTFTPMPPLADLQARFRIDPDSPSGLTRIIATSGPNGRLGPVLSKGTDGYYRLKFRDTFYRTHRIIYFMHTGTDPAEMVIDHRDGNMHNNRVENLRACTNQENLWNAKGKRKSTGLPKGITRISERSYYVRVAINGEIHEAYLDNFRAATHCLRSLRQRLHGAFARA